MITSHCGTIVFKKGENMKKIIVFIVVCMLMTFSVSCASTTVEENDNFEVRGVRSIDLIESNGLVDTYK